MFKHNNTINLHLRTRIYICHTFYHVYIACLKELKILRNQPYDTIQADIILSTMSNDFGNLQERLDKSKLFNNVYIYHEQKGTDNERLIKFKKDNGNIFLNMINRIIYTKLLGQLQAPLIPVNLKKFDEIYVFCDSDPIGYYLNYKKIYYHAIEDGLDCIRYYDTARYDNRGFFNLKALLSSLNLIFIQNGYGKYCLDMEVNNIDILPYSCSKYIESPRTELTLHLTRLDMNILLQIFLSNVDDIVNIFTNHCDHNAPKLLVLSEPLCNLTTREKIFKDIISQYGIGYTTFIKPHPRDILDYKNLFPECIVFDQAYPIEILNYIPDISFDKIISVFTVPSGLSFAKDILFLGEDFMDTYEDPSMHRQNDYI